MVDISYSKDNCPWVGFPVFCTVCLEGVTLLLPTCPAVGLFLTFSHSAPTVCSESQSTALHKGGIHAQKAAKYCPNQKGDSSCEGQVGRLAGTGRTEGMCHGLERFLLTWRGSIWSLSARWLRTLSGSFHGVKRNLRQVGTCIWKQRPIASVVHIYHVDRNLYIVFSPEFSSLMIILLEEKRWLIETMQWARKLSWTCALGVGWIPGQMLGDSWAVRTVHPEPAATRAALRADKKSFDISSFVFGGKCQPSTT